jgi:hypothetical protein
MSNKQIPARYRQVTEADLQARFDGLGLAPRCTVCGHSRFSLPLMYKQNPLQSKEPELVAMVVPHSLPSSLGGSQEVVFPLTCDHCGTMLFINAEWIVPETQWPASKEVADE